MPDTTPTPRFAPLYSRVMLKISGEALMGDLGFGLHPPTVFERIAREGEIGAGDGRRDLHGHRRSATSFAGSRAARRGWNAPPPTTWGDAGDRGKE